MKCQVQGSLQPGELKLDSLPFRVEAGECPCGWYDQREASLLGGDNQPRNLATFGDFLENAGDAKFSPEWLSGER